MVKQTDSLTNLIYLKINQYPVPPPFSPFLPNSTAAGTAILSKIAPLTVKYDLPGYDNPSVVKGRIITLEFPKFWLIGTYVPNAGAELKVNKK